MANKNTRFLNDLYKELYRLLCINKYSIVCLGSELRSDDRLGLVICDELVKNGIDSVKCVYGLENCISDIIDRKMEKILLIDGVVVENYKPGDIVLIYGIDALRDYSLTTTHTIPVGLAINYLRKMGLAKNIVVLGIVVENIGIGLEISSRVKKSIESITKTIVDVVDKCKG